MALKVFFTIYILISSTSQECLALHVLTILNNSTCVTGLTNIEFTFFIPIVSKILCAVTGVLILAANVGPTFVKKLLKPSAILLPFFIH